MDNITHTLIGLAAGEAVAAAVRASRDGLPAATRRNLLVVVAAVGSNLPDLDLAFTLDGLARDKLGYLLQHRGYTHTILGCLALLLLLYACASAWLRYRQLPSTRGDRLTLAATAALGVFLHLGMDALNSYGVHPFWPVDNGWHYGDAVFIVEPLYWLAAAPLLFVVRSRLARWCLATAVAIATAAVIVLHWSQPLQAVGIVLLTAAALFIGFRYTARCAAFVSAAAMFVVTMGFATASQVAATRVAAIAASSFPAATTFDTVLAPLPTNPLCWDVLLVQRGSAGYSARHGLLSIAPSAGAAACPRLLLPTAGTAPLTKVDAPATPALQWLGEFTMPTGRLAAFVTASCTARELTQFLRVPFAIETLQGRVMGDLRFDREPALGMSELDVSAHAEPACRARVPWLPPAATAYLLAAPSN